MKKIIILSIFLYSFSQIIGLSELLENIFPLLVNKRIVKVYTTPNYYKYFKKGTFILVKDCNKSDIVFGNIYCKNKPIFSLNYSFYKKNRNVIGVFYYRKGRPQLKFKKYRMLKFFNKIPKSLKAYVE